MFDTIGRDHLSIMEALQPGDAEKANSIHPSFKRIKPAHIENRRELEGILDDYGYERIQDANDMLGRTAAFVTSTLNYDVCRFYVDDIVERDHGFEIHQGDLRTEFYHFDIDGNSCFSTYPLRELFVPWSLLPNLRVGNHDFDAFEIQPHNRRGGKHYPGEDELRRREPQVYAQIENFLGKYTIPDLEQFYEELQVMLKHNIGEIPGGKTRKKEVPGTYSKLQFNPELSLEDIYDVNGVSVHVSSPDKCYAALELIHQITPIEFYWDFIQEPKPNGFQCLIAHPEERRLALEYQIRTYSMYGVAERGSAKDYRNGKWEE